MRGWGGQHLRARDRRGGGIGGAVARALSHKAEQAGLYKVVGKLFVDNESSRRLVARHGYREVGIHLRHGQIDGEWHDVSSSRFSSVRQPG